MNSNIMTLFGAVAGMITLSACGHPGVEKNFDRSETFTRLTSGADLSAPSDLNGATGQATYNGIAVASFSEGFGGTADLRMAVDLENQTLSGTMRDWVDGDPRNHNLRGEVRLFDGTLDTGGNFQTYMSGNLERTRVGGSITETPLLLLIGGGTAGAFYDSLNGTRASHMLGGLDGVTTSNTGLAGEMTGGFVAAR